jgi:SPP1 gp7 family putative phage head morphogenesis protein
MRGIDAATDAHFSLAMMKLRAAPGTTLGVVRILHDAWFGQGGFGESTLPELAKRGGDGKKAGDHGIEEIARHEKAFYDALTAGQKAAYDALKALVDEMFDERVGYDGADPWAFDGPIDEWKAKAFADLATHPTKAYMLGQMLLSEKLESPLHRPMLPTDGRAIQFLNHHTFNEIDSSFEGLKSNLRTALINGISSGENPKEVARKLANELSDYETQWDVVAITETSRAESQGRLRELDDAGEEYCIGSSAHDARTCDDCKNLIDGKVYKVKDVIANNNYGVKRDNWEPCIPLHPRSVAVNDRVLTATGWRPAGLIRPGEYAFTAAGRFRRVLATARRKHSGLIFNVGGARVTGDHPILTVDGWRSAADLADRVNVLGVRRESLVEIRADADETHDGPTAWLQQGLLRGVLRALALAGTVPPAAVYFDAYHRVQNGDIQVEALDSILWNRAFAERMEQVVHHLLAARHRALLLQRARVHGVLLRDAVRFHDPALNQAVARELVNQIRTASANAFGESFDRLACEMLGVERADLSLVQHRVDVSSSCYGGDVACLQVEGDESFFVEGLCVHNCRCVWLPHDGPG